MPNFDPGRKKNKIKTIQNEPTEDMLLLLGNGSELQKYIQSSPTVG